MLKHKSIVRKMPYPYLNPNIKLMHSFKNFSRKLCQWTFMCKALETTLLFLMCWIHALSSGGVMGGWESMIWTPGLLLTVCEFGVTAQVGGDWFLILLECSQEELMNKWIRLWEHVKFIVIQSYKIMSCFLITFKNFYYIAYLFNQFLEFSLFFQMLMIYK